MKYVQVMEKFDLRSIPDLDVCVLAALELFSSTSIPKLPVAKYKRPLVIGSGNAETTGKIVFKDHDAVFGNENSFKKKLQDIRGIDSVFIFSASGGKHAPLMVKAAKRKKKPVFLVTSNPHSAAGKLLSESEVFVFPKNREPYTYNTSTYMPMILGKTGEDTDEILNFILKKVSKIDFSKLKKYKAFYLLLPPEFELIRDMLDKKFVEMFGRQVPYSIYSTEYVKHATTVVARDDELFINFGCKNTMWGKNRLNVPLPKNADYVAMMAISYYVMGQIQKTRTAWFTKNIESYCKKVSKVFGQKIKPIVE